MDDTTQAIALLEQTPRPSGSRNIIIKNRLPSDYQALYVKLMTELRADFPPIHGYETAHDMAIERLAWSYVQQKIDDGKMEQEVEFKNYKVNFQIFARTFENLLREAKLIGADMAFKTALITEVMEVIDRTIPDKSLKRTVVLELQKVARHKPTR